MLTASGILLVVSLLALVAAWRGRRVDDHPLCRACGFDLVGTYPRDVVCPECGGGLEAKRRGLRRSPIRIGNRRRRRRLMALALIGLAIGLPAGTVAVLNVHGGAT